MNKEMIKKLKDAYIKNGDKLFLLAAERLADIDRINAYVDRQIEHELSWAAQTPDKKAGVETVKKIIDTATKLFML